MASAAILVHTAQDTTIKGKSSKPKSNQHQLAPINHPQASDNNSTGENDYNGDNAVEDAEITEVVDAEIIAIQ